MCRKWVSRNGKWYHNPLPICSLLVCKVLFYRRSKMIPMDGSANTNSYCPSAGSSLDRVTFSSTSSTLSIVWMLREMCNSCVWERLKLYWFCVASEHLWHGNLSAIILGKLSIFLSYHQLVKSRVVFYTGVGIDMISSLQWLRLCLVSVLLSRNRCLLTTSLWRAG